MLREIQEVQNLATKYSKAELGRMVQMGLIDPQKAMMAGMMIDRIQKQNAQPPQTTVAQDVLGMDQQQGQPQQPPMQGAAPQQMPPQMPPQQAPGIEALPAQNIGNYADGGIVAFADRGAVKADPDWGDLPRGVAESSKIKAKNKTVFDKIKEFSLEQPDKNGYVDNPLNFNMGKGLWKGTYATPYDKDIVDAAKEAGIDPRVYWRLLYTESHFDPKAESYKGKKYGYGIAQISHHHGIPEEDLEDPKHSIKAGAWILKRFINQAGGDYRKGLEGYKGAVSEAGKAAMAPHIDKVLGDSTLAPPPKKKKLPKLKQGQVALHPVPVESGMQVVRTAGKPTASEIAAAKSSRRAALTGPEDVYDIGSGNFITHGWDTSAPMRMDEYEQEGAPHYGGWFTRDELEGLTELRGEGQAHGGLLSLSHGGYIPRYAGASGSWVQSNQSQNTRPLTTQEQQIYEEYGINPAQVTPQQAQAAAQSAENVVRRKALQSELQSLEKKYLYTRPSAEDSKRMADIRAELNIKSSYVPVANTPQQTLPPIESPAQQGTQKEFAEKSLPPVTVTADRIPVGASPSLVQNQPANQGPFNSSAFGLPGIDSYRKKIDLQAELPPVPEKGDAEKQLEKTRALREKAGYDENFYNNMIAKMEERKGDRATEKDRAVGEAIMQAGFKLMGARRGEGFKMLSEGAQEGLMSYQKAMKDYQNRLDKLDERMDAYRLADSEARRTGADSAIAAAQKQDELRQKAEEKVAEAKNNMAVHAAQFAVNLRDTDARIVAQAMANRSAENVARIRAEDSGSAKNTLPAIINSAIDDWNKMDITQRKNMEKNQGIKNDQDYVNYRLRMLGLPPVSALPSSTSGWGELKVTGGK